MKELTAMRLRLTAALICLLLFPNPAPAQQPETPQRLEWRGTHSIQKTPLARLITSDSQWHDLWRGLLGAAVKAPPPVDFRDYVVAVVFLGERRTGGYGVEFLEPLINEKKMVILYKERRPGPGSFVTQALTQPYHIKAFKRIPGLEVSLARVED